MRLFFISIALLTLFISCAKEEISFPTQDDDFFINAEIYLARLTGENETNFFSLDYIPNHHQSIADSFGFEATVSQEALDVRLDFLRKNDSIRFVENLIHDYGWPVWGAIRKYQSDDNRHVYAIPFVSLEHTHTISVLFAISTDLDPFYENTSNTNGFFYVNTKRLDVIDEIHDNLDCENRQLVFRIFNYIRFDDILFQSQDDLLIQSADSCEDGLHSEDIPISFRDGCSTTIEVCDVKLPQVLLPESEVEFRDCIYITFEYECGGSGGIGSGNGSIPGGNAGNQGGAQGGHTGSTFESLILNSIFAECTTASSDAQGGSDNPNCGALLEAILNLGEGALSVDAWLYLFNSNSRLLSLAATISPDLSDALNFYISYLLDGKPINFSFREFSRAYQEIFALQEMLGLSDIDRQWLLENTMNASSYSLSHARSLVEFLSVNYSEEDIVLAKQLLDILIAADGNFDSAANSFINSTLSSSLISEEVIWSQITFSSNNDLWEILFEVLKEIAPNLVPILDTYVELRSSFEAFNNGNYAQSAESFVFAAITLLPVDKLKDVLRLAKGLRKTIKIYKQSRFLRSLDNNIVEGFKKTVLDSNKMSHIFDNSGHNLVDVVSAAGDREKVISKLYERIHFQNVISTIPLSQTREIIVENVFGFSITARLTNVEGVLRIGTMFR